MKNAIVTTNAMVQKAYETNEGLRAMTESNPSMMRRLFPAKHDRIMSEARARQLVTVSDHVCDALELKMQTELQAFKENCNDYLLEHKGENRKRQARFFAELAEEVEREVSRLTHAFIQQVEEMWANMEKVKVDFLRKMEEARIEQAAERYYEAVDKCLARFHGILDEEVSI